MKWRPSARSAKLALALALGGMALALACPTGPDTPGGTGSDGSLETPPGEAPDGGGPEVPDDGGAPEAPDGGEGPDAGDAGVRFGLDERPANPTCVAPPRPVLATGVTTAPAFPKLTFRQPLLALQAPGDASRVFVVERGGRILVFPNQDEVATVSTFLDLSGKVEVDHQETGLLGLAFHRRFATTGEVFVSYVADLKGDRTSIISRFVSRDGGKTLDPRSEEVVLRLGQPYSTHNGGHIAFGPDGYLYVGFGDGGGRSDPDRRAQDPNSLLGKLLRLDVDGARPYAIPPTNPFIGKGGRPEVYALGFRNPWRWSFDRVTGELWLGDVGERTEEEVNRVVAGGNHGWSIMEGTRCFQGGGCRGPSLTLPVVTYGRDEGVSITGGYVYRGSRVPALVGHYVYGDFGSGNLWALDPWAPVGEGNPRLLASTPFAISSFAEWNDGEVLVVDFGRGKLHRLVPAGQPPASQLAPLLSRTGCVEPRAPWKPAAGVLPYDVNSPLWSDGADKERLLALPDGTTVQVGADGHLEFPPGSVLMKHFRLGARWVETRLFMRHPDGSWAGYSYEWNDEQTDAVLLEVGKVKQVEGRTWTFPSRSECMLCHNAAAGFTLGPEVAQLNRDFLYPGGRRANQLETLVHIGLLEPLAEQPSALPRLASPSGEAPLEARARAYLHANCASCHRPGGLGRGSADLRFHTPLALAGVCEVPPETGSFGIPDAKLLAPGDPERSLLHLRLRARDAIQMPPLATRVTDADGAALVAEWIRSLSECPKP